MARWLTGWIVVGVLGMMTGQAQAGAVGPSSYLQTSDSPWDGLSFSYFYLETFEDHLFNTPGVVADKGGVSSVAFGPTLHDSVDADDGSIDGSGLDGDAYFATDGFSSTKLTFTFSETALGLLPTHAGLVWTDGGYAAEVTFEAFGPGGLLGTIAPGAIGDYAYAGETAEDRFFGWIDAGGISRIVITSTGGGIEVDHLQYGYRVEGAVVPLPRSFAMGFGTLGVLAIASGVRKRKQSGALKCS